MSLSQIFLQSPADTLIERFKLLSGPLTSLFAPVSMKPGIEDPTGF